MRPSMRTVVNATLLAVLAGAVASTPAVAHITQNAAHVWNHIAPRLSEWDGGPNQPDDPVHWTRLKNVPDAWTDGDRNQVLEASFGLRKTDRTRTSPARLDARTDVLQRRVRDECGAGKVIRTVTSTGGVTCTP